MKRVLTAFIGAIISIGMAAASDSPDDLRSASVRTHDYHVDISSQGGFVALQHFKAAPYPGNGLEQQLKEESFQQVKGSIELGGTRHDTHYFGGWLYLDLSKQDVTSLPSIVENIQKIAAGGSLDEMSSNAKASFSLAAKELAREAEKLNLKNPYAGRSLTASYAVEGGIPVGGELVPTGTGLENTDRLLKSLAAVYGGSLIKDEKGTFTFTHGPHKVFSYGDKMVSVYCGTGPSIRGEFRGSDDGKVANDSLKITNFETWFK